MLIVCSLGIALIVVLYICTIPYKNTFRKKITREEHKLIPLYGMSMFIADRFPKRFVNKKDEVENAIQKLTVRETIQKEKYLYIVKKISISIMVIMISLMLGVAMGISQKVAKMEHIKELKRDNSKTLTYKFIAEDKAGQQETIVVDINSKELTENETYEILRKMEKPLVKKVLGENESTEKVNKPLNFVSSIGDGISVSWDISDNSILDYDGEICDSVPPQGCIVSIKATMMLNNISTDYTFSVNVFPEDKEQGLQQQIQKYVNENDKYDEKVKLPETINGQTVSYYPMLQETQWWLVPVGIVVAVAIFILKDQDLKKEVKKRNHQIMLDYPEIVEKILLYYNAGLSVKSGVERIVTEYKKDKQKDKKIYRYAYEELELSLTKMKSGVSEIEAINEYGNRCGLHCYIKLAGIIEQNLKRGSREVSYALKNELSNAMFERKNIALKEGSEISTKLLGPMIVMLVISIVIIMVPALWSMNM